MFILLIPDLTQSSEVSTIDFFCPDLRTPRQASDLSGGVQCDYGYEWSTLVALLIFLFTVGVSGPDRVLFTGCLLSVLIRVRTSWWNYFRWYLRPLVILLY